jgi:hypothetical protein
MVANLKAWTNLIGAIALLMLGGSIFYLFGVDLLWYVVALLFFLAGVGFTLFILRQALFLSPRSIKRLTYLVLVEQMRLRRIQAQDTDLGKVGADQGMAIAVLMHCPVLPESPVYRVKRSGSRDCYLSRLDELTAFCSDVEQALEFTRYEDALHAMHKIWFDLGREGRMFIEAAEQQVLVTGDRAD